MGRASTCRRGGSELAEKGLPRSAPDCAPGEPVEAGGDLELHVADACEHGARPVGVGSAANAAAAEAQQRLRERVDLVVVGGVWEGRCFVDELLDKARRDGGVVVAAVGVGAAG